MGAGIRCYLRRTDRRPGNTGTWNDGGNDSAANIQIEPTRQTVRAIMSQRRAAHLKRWAAKTGIREYENTKHDIQNRGTVESWR